MSNIAGKCGNLKVRRTLSGYVMPFFFITPRTRGIALKEQKPVFIFLQQNNRSLVSQTSPHLYPFYPSSAPPSLASLASLCPRTSSPFVIEWKIPWLLFKGELRWRGNRLPSAQPVFIYRDPNSKIVGSWRKYCYWLHVCLNAPLTLFRSRHPPLLLFRHHQHWQTFVSVPTQFLIMWTPAPRSVSGVQISILPVPKENNQQTIVALYLLSSVRFLHLCCRNTALLCWKEVEMT